MGDAAIAALDHVARSAIEPLHDLEAIARRQHAVVAEGADAVAGERGIAEQPVE